ncbi:hypothetical protein [Derxia gummosa]|uniref:Cytochrome c domain-containing protein n=1 Tax=Derxia gummosa DSM 723 TaxID=1121388 RepID=A0A8B6X6R8_9BURK|nr:hypothetical protein [Derxia gummosa]
MRHFPRRAAFGSLVALAGLAAQPAAQAVPSFARQTGEDCAACHIGGYGPQLTPHGIRFKLGGYTDTDGKDGKVPLSAMAVGSYTRTGKDQDPPPDGGKANNNLALDEASVFLAGRLADQFGAFVQVTYDGIGKTTALDQADLRFVKDTQLGGRDLLLGLSLNNNPGVQDPFATLPVWRFPYTSSALGFGGVDAASLLNGGVEGRVLGLSGYGFWDDHLYAELGTYRSLSPAMQTKFGLGSADDPGRLGHGTTYWRLAWFDDRKRDAWSAGVYGFNSLIRPDRQLASPGNRYNDLGADAQYQYLGTREHVWTVQGSYLHEKQRRDALVADGGAEQVAGTLNEWRLNGSYHWRQTWGVTLGQFITTGSADALLYADNSSLKPNTTGQILQLDWTPFGKEGSWGEPWANLRLGLQYTRYGRFNGSRSNYDGSGRNASDNNTLFLFAWTSF